MTSLCWVTLVWILISVCLVVVARGYRVCSEFFFYLRPEALIDHGLISVVIELHTQITRFSLLVSVKRDVSLLVSCECDCIYP